MEGTPIRVEQEGLADGWDPYVRTHPHGTPFHLRAWCNAVEEAYGHRPDHLTARQEGRLVGVLPLFEVNSLLAGRLLVSVPYATYGGILADSHEAAQALFDNAKDLASDVGAKYLELRHREASGLDLPVIDRYDTFRKTLPETVDEVLAGLPRKARAAARKGIKILGEEAADIGPQWLDAVYDLYTVSLRRLGSPNYSRRFFHALRENFGEDCICLVVRDEGKPTSGVVSFVFRDEIVPYFSGCLEEALPRQVNNVMYLRLMEFAVRRGLRVFDFNRTRRDNHGPYDFKRHHGFEPTPLHYQVYLSGTDAMPNLTPSNRTYALAGRVWQKLPLWITRPVGARITKWVP